MRLSFPPLFALALVAGCEGTPKTADPAKEPAEPAAATSYPMLASEPVDAARAKAIMKERHDGMEKIGKAVKALKQALDSSSPDLTVVRASAETISDLSPKVPGWYPPGTGPDIGKTGAKPEIWKDPKDFASKANDMNQAAKALSAATAGTDVAAMKTAFADLGKTCKACHDDYRAKDD